MKLSSNGKSLIKSFEGLRLNAYKDSAGVWTIGYGSTRYSNGTTVKQGDKLKTIVQASELFEHTLAEYEEAVNKAVKVPLNQNQFDALASLTYNIGTGVVHGTTLIKKLNEADYTGAAQQFLVWNKITDSQTHQKVVSQTLVKRREKERAYFLLPCQQNQTV